MERRFHIGQTVNIQTSGMPSHVPGDPSAYCHYNDELSPIQVRIDSESGTCYLNGCDIPCWNATGVSNNIGYWIAETDCMEYTVAGGGTVVNVDMSQVIMELQNMYMKLDSIDSNTMQTPPTPISKGIDADEYEGVIRVLSSISNPSQPYVVVKDVRRAYVNFKEAFIELGFKNTNINPPIREGSLVKLIRMATLKSTDEVLYMVEDEYGNQSLYHVDGVRDPSDFEKGRCVKIFEKSLGSSDTLDELVIRSIT